MRDIVALIFILPIYAVFMFIAKACYFIACNFEDFSYLLGDGIEAYKKHKLERLRHRRMRW